MKKYEIQYEDKWYSIGDEIRIKVSHWLWSIYRRYNIQYIKEDASGNTGSAVYYQVYGSKVKGSFNGNIRISTKLTVEEARERTLKENIGKHIVLYKAKTIQVVVTREPGYSETDMGQRYLSHYEDHTHSEVTSAESIEGILIDATETMVKVDNTWYAFGVEAEKIYEMNIIK